MSSVDAKSDADVVGQSDTSKATQISRGNFIHFIHCINFIHTLVTY